MLFRSGRIVIEDRLASSLRFGSTILAVDRGPRNGDAVLDVQGAFVLPGLINSHDHLELNHYGRVKFRERYTNAAAWIDDMRPALSSDRRLRANAGFPLSSRLFVGGLKNVLSGATTVVHHNPRYRELGGWFPVRVVRRYGWAHSFALEGQPVGARGERGPDVRAACAATPPGRPFIVHAAEGIDADAAAELPRLEALGCLRPNTVLVHGVAITPLGWRRALRSGAGMVWCPASNQFLFGETAAVRALLDLSPASWAHLALGTDSRLTGAGDLLDELRAAAATGLTTPSELLRMVTDAPARLFGLQDAGTIRVGGPADLLVIRAAGGGAAESLVHTRRGDVLMVVTGGRPMLAAPDLAAVFAARRTRARGVAIDGAERLADVRLVTAIERCPIREPGVNAIS